MKLPRLPHLGATCVALALTMSACSSSDATVLLPASSDDDQATAAETTPSSTEADTTTTTTEAADTSAEIDYLGSYELADETFGTMVTVAVDDEWRTITTNALPDHETGEFPTTGNPNTISAQALTWAFPVAPSLTGEPTNVRTTGVAVNGVKFEPETAETVTCATGESYRIEALQDEFNLGFDFNNAHVQPTGEYHYHGVSELLVEAYANNDDLVLLGFASDGHLIYYSKSSAYEPSWALTNDTRTGTDCAGSFPGALEPGDLEGTTPDGTYGSDWEFTAGSGDLDQCNGIEIDGEYAYVMTNEYPFVPRCLMGDVSNVDGIGAGFGGGEQGEGDPPPRTDDAARPEGAPPVGEDGSRPAGDEGTAPPPETADGTPPPEGQDDTAPPPETADGTPPPADDEGAPPPGTEDAARPDGPPDMAGVAAELGVDEATLTQALGQPPFDLEAAASALGVSVADLEAALPPPPTR